MIGNINLKRGSSDFEFRDKLERDYDRVLYSSAFRKLTGVTQVINPEEGQIFHNRLTHSIKVAQTGQRLAQKILRDKDISDKGKIIKNLGGLDPSVVGAAALAHDLGNPPFGHMAENKLNELTKRFVDDGFEGNAQTFRIVNKLSFGYKGNDGIKFNKGYIKCNSQIPLV